MRASASDRREYFLSVYVSFHVDYTSGEARLSSPVGRRLRGPQSPVLRAVCRGELLALRDRARGPQSRETALGILREGGVIFFFFNPSVTSPRVFVSSERVSESSASASLTYLARYPRHVASLASTCTLKCSAMRYSLFSRRRASMRVNASPPYVHPGTNASASRWRAANRPRPAPGRSDGRTETEGPSAAVACATRDVPGDAGG